MLLLCADFYVNMPGCGQATVHYGDGCLSGTLLHFLGALLGRARKKKCCAGPVGGGEECPGLGSKIQDAREAQMQLKVMRGYQKGKQ